MATPSSRVTIKDVSRRAGVSPTTVSHALNGRGRVHDETRERILAAAAELGYVANPIARALKIGRSMLIVVELPATTEGKGLESAFLRDVLIGAAERAMEHGYALAIAGPTAAARGSLPPSDGALVVDPVGGDAIIEDASRRGVPVVTISRYVDQPDDMPSVGSDYAAGMGAILDHLAAAGYQRPALVTTRHPFAFAQACLDGYEAWMAAAGKKPRVRYAPGYPSITSGASAARALLKLAEPPDAIIGVTEPLAVGAGRALTEQGVRIPEEMGLASVSDSERLRSSAVPVTALEDYAVDLGRRAANIVIDLIEAGDTRRRGLSVDLPTRLNTRSSTAR